MNQYNDLEMCNDELKNEINDKIKDYVNNNENKDNKEIVIRVIHSKRQLTKKEQEKRQEEYIEMMWEKNCQLLKGMLCTFCLVMFMLILALVINDYA